MHIIFTNWQKSRGKHNLILACMERGYKVSDHNDPDAIITQQTPLHGMPALVKIDIPDKDDFKRIERKVKDFGCRYWKGGK